MSHFSSQFMSIIRRFHGSRCIISNMNNGRDMNALNQLVNEANRQKLELRLIELESIVKVLTEKVNKIDKITNFANINNTANLSMARDYKHVN